MAKVRLLRKLVLGSESARRRELLAQIGIFPDLFVTHKINETPARKELPRDYSLRMAKEKALDVAARCEAGNLVLAADTIAAVGRKILEKPVDADEARKFLRLLSGRRHKIYTSICLSCRELGLLTARQSVSTIKFKSFSGSEIETFVASDQWRGNAGGYTVAGLAAAYIQWMQGSYFGILGLPLSDVYALLENFVDQSA